MTAVQDIIESLKRIAQDYPYIKAVYLFGSLVTHRATKANDTDIAIISNQEITAWDRIELETEFSNKINTDVDLIIFNQARPLLQHQILKYGSLIYEVDQTERIRQETRARYNYLDSKYLYKEFGELLDGR